MAFLAKSDTACPEEFEAAMLRLRGCGTRMPARCDTHRVVGGLGCRRDPLSSGLGQGRRHPDESHGDGHLSVAGADRHRGDVLYDG